MRRTATSVFFACLLAIIIGGCADGEQGPSLRSQIERTLTESMGQIGAYTENVYDTLRPVSFLTAAERSSLRRYLNPQQLSRARALGARPSSTAELEQFQSEGRLVRLDDSTEYWAIRELNYSTPWVTPDTRAMLQELGRRFQSRLEEMGLPPYRLEISSVLRTAQDQAALRQRNPNAARGTSTHEFGTTVDIPYSSYAPPAEPVVDLNTDAVPWLEPYLRQVEDVMLARAAAEKSRELTAVLGDVLREMQSEGKVMVTMERRQPVYHMTVAQRYE